MSVCFSLIKLTGKLKLPGNNSGQTALCATGKSAGSYKCVLFVHKTKKKTFQEGILRLGIEHCFMQPLSWRDVVPVTHRPIGHMTCCTRKTFFSPKHKQVFKMTKTFFCVIENDCILAQEHSGVNFRVIRV